MPAASWEDLDDFLDPQDGFAFPAVITLQSGITIPLNVIFDEKAREADAHDAFTFDTGEPCAQCREDLVVNVARGDSIAITFPDGVRTFDVRAAAKPDGTGWAVLPLSVP